jgi:hypothetical protein
MPGRGSSSAMPRKRNPVGCTIILAVHAAAKDHASTPFEAMANAHERPAGRWHAEWNALPSLFGLVSRHPAVLLAAVVAQPDPTWGEPPCAFLELKPGAAEISEAEIIRYCRQSLARLKVPKRVVFGEIPKTSTGRSKKFMLRERAAGREGDKPV